MLLFINHCHSSCHSRDLILAAELGKALLERNEELQRRNEEIVQETSTKIEVIEQEKYVMQQNFALRER